MPGVVGWLGGWLGWVGLGGWVFEFRDQLKLELINYENYADMLAANGYPHDWRKKIFQKAITGY